MTWTGGTVMLAFPPGKISRQAKILDGVLAVHHGPARTWCVSHVQTGYMIPYTTRPTLREAKRVAERLRPVVDWRRVTERASRKTVRRVRGALGVVRPMGPVV